jgi:hypothetical protein
MSSHQDFTPEQLKRIGSAVKSGLASTDDTRTLSTIVKDILRNQDLLTTRSGPTRSVNNSPPIRFLQLPPEIRNKIYRYCLVVGEVYPRPKSDEDARLNDRSNFQQPQTQMFQLCRQIFAEAAPLYFAENKFVLSYGELPWSHTTEDLGFKPVSRVAHQSLRSLSITYDMRDDNILPSILQTRCSDGRLETGLLKRWRKLSRLLTHLDLRLLEVSMDNCYCAFCPRRMTCAATSYLGDSVRLCSQLILTGLCNNDSVVLTGRIFVDADDSYSEDGLQWHTVYDYDNQDSDKKLWLAFQSPTK